MVGEIEDWRDWELTAENLFSKTVIRNLDRLRSNAPTHNTNNTTKAQQAERVLFWVQKKRRREKPQRLVPLPDKIKAPNKDSTDRRRRVQTEDVNDRHSTEGFEG
jgi:hypothetical protein